MNRLNHKILGSAAKLHARRLKTVAVIETNADGRQHYHAMIDRPCYFSFEKFKVVVTDQWLRTDFGYRQTISRKQQHLDGPITCSNLDRRNRF
jgi:hypothetical protein